MAHIPPPPNALDHDREIWHKVFDPHFDDLVSWGYIDGAYPLSYGSTCEGYTSTDGEIALREGATKLGYGTDLSGATLYLVSSDAGDTQTYRLQGMDANGDYATADVTATGTTPVAFAGTWNHAQRLINISAGTTNAGYIYVSTNAAGPPTTLAHKPQVTIHPLDNYAINPELWIPNDQYVTISAFDFSLDVNQATTIRIMANRQGQWILNFKLFCSTSQFEQTFHTPLYLAPGDRMRVLIEAGGGTASSCSFGMSGNVFDRTNLTPGKAGIGYIFAE